MCVRQHCLTTTLSKRTSDPVNSFTPSLSPSLPPSLSSLPPSLSLAIYLSSSFRFYITRICLAKSVYACSESLHSISLSHLQGMKLSLNKSVQFEPCNNQATWQLTGHY